nr:carbohydrate ABC transporter permease [Spirochaetaceae bacterium]
LLMIFICFITIYPIWYTVVLSFNDANDTQLGGIYWWPRVFSIDSYSAVFQSNVVITGFVISILRTVIGTVTAIFFTSMIAYAYSKKHLIGRKFYLTMGTFTMFFSGGLIPGFLLFKNLGLLDNFLVYIIPTAFNFFNLIIFMTFFRGIPESLEDSALLDGANEFRTFMLIILPLSTPVLATISLFHGVWHWNDYFWGILFLNMLLIKPVLILILLYLREMKQRN